ncbi:MAG: hypothetical protein M9887_11200 [Chitinophagales bacterium]|nr:hypothetical protein [Chitinophagales bacterium]
MKYYISFFFLSFFAFQTVKAESNLWVKQNISGSVSVYFPETPNKIDTAHQTMYFYREGDIYMLTSLTPLSESEKLLDRDSLLDVYIKNTIQDATSLVYSNVSFNGVPAKFYKVRMDDFDNDIRGLIVDSYNLIFQDTLYSFSYFRYHASELYDYKKQKKFFDKIEIENSDIIGAGSLDSSQFIKNADTLAYENGYAGNVKWLWIALGICLFVIVGLIVRIAWLKKKE